MTRLYIPSTGRSDRQPTLENLPQEWVDKTALVVSEKEKAAYAAMYPMIDIITHPNLDGIGRIRHYICEMIRDEYILMLDDDMVFYVRRKGKLFSTSRLEVGACLDMLVGWLDAEPDIGETSISLSLVNFRKEADVYYNEKCGPVMCIRKAAYDSLKYKFNALPKLHEDNAVTLGLLTAGYRVKVSYEFAFKNLPPLPEHRKTGCSGYRTQAMEKQACIDLKKMFDPYVQIHESKKPTTTVKKPNLYTLYDRPVRPIIRWKRAYENSSKLQIHGLGRKK